MALRVVVIASYPESLVNFRRSLIQELIDAGHTVHAAAPGLSPDSVHAGALAEMGVAVHDIPLQRTGTNPVADLGSLMALFALMRKLKAEAMLSYTIKPVIYGTLAGWLAGVPHRFALITGLGYAFTEQRASSFLSKIVQRMYALALSRTEVVFFQNSDDAASFHKMGLLSTQSKVCVVNGSGVDIHQYAFSPIPLGRIGPATTFLLIARLLGDKGVREYIEAARCIKAQYPDTVFRLVGWIDENPDAIREQELNDWVSEGVVEYLGRLSDVRPAIADCTVYVLPSYREGTPRTVLEAMAMGRPIITTDAPGCRETTVEGDNGFLVPVKDVDKLAEVMLRFIHQPELASCMGGRSRQIAEEKYDVNKVNAVMLHAMGMS